MSDSSLYVKIDDKICQGTGYCVRLAPHVFDVQGGLGMVIDRHPPGEQEALLEEVATLCPTRAITY